MNSETIAEEGSQTETGLAHPASGRAKRALQWLSAFLSVLLILGCLSEAVSIVVLTAVDFYREQTPNPQSRHAYYRNRPLARQYWAEFNAEMVHKYMPYVIWRRAPFKGKFINIDADGLRRTVNPSCAPGARRIWMFGSSQLWGLGSTDDQTIPSQVAEKYTRGIGPVCVTNYADGGWVNFQEIIQLEIALKHAPAPPDLVIFLDGFSDVFTQYQTGEADAHMDLQFMRKTMENSGKVRSRFSFFADLNTNKLIQLVGDDVSKMEVASGAMPMSRQNLDLLAHEVAAGYQQNMAIVQALSNGYGFKYFSIWGPAVSLGHKSLAPFEQQSLERMDKETPGLRESVAETYSLIFAKADPHLVNFAGIFDQVPDDLYLDIAHISPVGNEIVADRILDSIKRFDTESASAHARP
jgi:hypothetical protein